jgi:hypothetical protein
VALRLAGNAVPDLAFVEAYNPKGGFDLRRATGSSNKELKLTKRG